MNEKQISRKVSYWLKNKFDTRHCLGYLLACKDAGFLSREKYDFLCVKVIGE